MSVHPGFACVKDFAALYRSCCLCPRRCGVDRALRGGKRGFCRQTETLRVAHIGPHFGEEPPISGSAGSGTVFFSGCSLRCSYCQNFQISHGAEGIATDLAALVESIREMVATQCVHNVNFVSPDHFFPHVFMAVQALRTQGIHVPILYNMSGYQEKALLRMAEPFVDIYLPDFKYGMPELARALSGAEDYGPVALDAIGEMLVQKGFLDCATDGGLPAVKGVLVRHLILPGHAENSVRALTALFLEFGKDLPLSVMSQYHPSLPQKDPDLNRFLDRATFERVYAHVLDLGFRHVFYQPLDAQGTGREVAQTYLPDFRRSRPFAHP